MKPPDTLKGILGPRLSMETQVLLLTITLQPRHGAQGTYDEASNGVKESDFGTKNDDAVIEKILLSGDLQESKVSQISWWGETWFSTQLGTTS